ncbi:conserved hypothetical protein [Ricinus communis]|uniref:Uncharacterized protein n=1 Tax=Ricinus communis TaxID=3988 RepID=B9SIX0_RICCO|nr:conserved hypothetical protein [Ricinus communis]
MMLESNKVKTVYGAKGTTKAATSTPSYARHISSSQLVPPSTSTTRIRNAGRGRRLGRGGRGRRGGRGG